LCEALDRTHSEMLVDLSAVPFIDSRGIAMMARPRTCERTIAPSRGRVCSPGRRESLRSPASTPCS
jgi:hypothetical protein